MIKNKVSNIFKSKVLSDNNKERTSMDKLAKVNQILNNTSKEIEEFHDKLTSTPSSNVPIDEYEHLTSVLRESHVEINKTLTGTAHPNIDQKTMQRILKAIQFLQHDKGTQIKVGAIETSLFYETVREFQNLLDKLKIKRGQKIEKVDLDTKFQF